MLPVWFGGARVDSRASGQEKGGGTRWESRPGALRSVEGNGLQ